MSNSLYRELILDHYNFPRNCGELKSATHFFTADNPLCGDKCSIYIKVQDNIIKDIRHITNGCALCIASASMLTDLCIGKKVDEIKGMGSNSVMNLMKIHPTPTRLKCIYLPFETIKKALASIKP